MIVLPSDQDFFKYKRLNLYLDYLVKIFKTLSNSRCYLLLNKSCTYIQSFIKISLNYLKLCLDLLPSTVFSKQSRRASYLLPFSSHKKNKYLSHREAETSTIQERLRKKRGLYHIRKAQ